MEIRARITPPKANRKDRENGIEAQHTKAGSIVMTSTPLPEQGETMTNTTLDELTIRGYEIGEEMNDKLDQIIVENNNKLLDAVNGRTNPTLSELVDPAKQAILTLFKEMIAEAKPEKPYEDNHEWYNVQRMVDKQTVKLDELKAIVRDGLANHTGEFANPWIFKDNYSHELLTDILNDIMASERLFKNLSQLLIKERIKEVKHLACYEDKQLGGYIDLDIGEVNDRITNLENQLGEKS